MQILYLCFCREVITKTFHQNKLDTRFIWKKHFEPEVCAPRSAVQQNQKTTKQKSPSFLCQAQMLKGAENFRILIALFYMWCAHIELVFGGSFARYDKNQIIIAIIMI